MTKKEEEKTIIVIRKSIVDFLKDPKSIFKELLSSTVGRINISAGQRIFYLMTEKKFDFFIEHALKKQKQFYEKKLLESGNTESSEQKDKVDERYNPAQRSLLQIKSKFELFSNLSDSDVLYIVDDIVISQYPKDRKVFTVGTTDKHMFFIVRGTVSVFIGPGGDIEVAQLGKTQFFGEMAYIMNEPRTATIKVTSEVALLLSFSVRPKIAKGAEKSFMKFFSNINKILIHKLLAENKKKH